jgi:hypothetical protein
MSARFAYTVFCDRCGWKRHGEAYLVVDRDLGVMCRTCNATKGATADRARAQARRRGDQR